MDLSRILKHSDVVFEARKDLKKFSTMRLEAVGDLITVSSKEGLMFALENLTKNNIKYRVIGWGANILLPKESSIPYLQLDFSFDRNVFNQVQEKYTLPASVSLATLTSHANKFGLSGWEVFTGIPASLGGAIFMNAGTNLGEIGSVVSEVKLITKNGQEKVVTINENSFSYRHNHFVDEGDVIYEVTLFHKGTDPAISKKIKEYLEMRTRTQPLKEWTCGCVFKNTKDDVNDLVHRAGQYIDITGLKGLSVGNLRISPKHANFMENDGESSYEDVLKMISIIQNELKLQTGVSFETEVEY